jgi:glycosyltransferase involved in cell wall biosynthesis
VPSPEQIAVLIPCLNEAQTIGKVIADFRRAAPAAEIVVIDNGSTDDTASIALSLGARVIREGRRGKGRALRTAFEQVDAAIYVLADGDDQMPAERLPALVEPIIGGSADIVIGSRAPETLAESQLVRLIGNRALSWFVRTTLGAELTDVLSGYRALTRGAVERITLAATDFEIEVELTIKAAHAGLRIGEVPIRVRARPAGNLPRTRVVRDGLRILGAIVVLTFRGRLRFLVPLGTILLASSAVLAALGARVGGAGELAAWAAALLVGLMGAGSLAAATVLMPVARRLHPDVRAGARVSPQA